MYPVNRLNRIFKCFNKYCCLDTVRQMTMSKPWYCSIVEQKNERQLSQDVSAEKDVKTRGMYDLGQPVDSDTSQTSHRSSCMSSHTQ